VVDVGIGVDAALELAREVVDSILPEEDGTGKVVGIIVGVGEELILSGLVDGFGANNLVI